MVQSRNDPERYDLRKKFIDELTAAGGTVEEAADKTLSLSIRGFNLSVDLAGLQEEYDRTGDLSKYERLLAAVLTSGKTIPSWEDARPNVYPVFYAASMDPGDVVTEPMTAQFDRAYFVEIGDRREWIDAAMLAAWRIDAAALRRAAAANLRKQIECADLMTETDDDGIRIGYFDTDFFYPSSFLVAPDFRRKITEYFSMSDADRQNYFDLAGRGLFIMHHRLQQLFR